MDAQGQEPFVARASGSGRRIDRFLDVLLGVRRPFTLVVDDVGIAVHGRGGVAATWDEIDDVYVLTMGRTRFLVYQLTPEAAASRGKSDTRHPGRWHEPSLLWSVQPAVQTLLLDTDEHALLGAVERFSGGAYPTAERLFVDGRQDLLRRDAFGAGRWTPRGR